MTPKTLILHRTTHKLAWLRFLQAGWRTTLQPQRWGHYSNVHLLVRHLISSKCILKPHPACNTGHWREELFVRYKWISCQVVVSRRGIPQFASRATLSTTRHHEAPYLKISPINILHSWSATGHTSNFQVERAMRWRNGNREELARLQLEHSATTLYRIYTFLVLS